MACTCLAPSHGWRFVNRPSKNKTWLHKRNEFEIFSVLWIKNAIFFSSEIFNVSPDFSEWYEACTLFFVTCKFCFNTLRLGQNGRHFADDIFKCILFDKTFRILNEIWLKYVPYGPIDNMAALVQLMAWRWTSTKPLSEAMLVCFTDSCMSYSASMS